MSPYPMVKMPKVDDFLNRLEEGYGVEIEEAPCNHGNIGNVSMLYLTRDFDGKTSGVVLPEDLGVDNGMLNPHVIRNICNVLQIPKEDFGLTLGLYSPLLEFDIRQYN